MVASGIILYHEMNLPKQPFFIKKFANKANFTSCETKDKANIKPMLSSYFKFLIILEIENCWSW
jgi:hypothetical protein